MGDRATDTHASLCLCLWAQGDKRGPAGPAKNTATRKWNPWAVSAQQARLAAGVEDGLGPCVRWGKSWSWGVFCGEQVSVIY